ncbi:hypothetical protein GobsT_30900 [Gemmata obscuriglobus]|uniref:Uncharacterized protein n=1 Tax=Gemmata obscuriglobus TaxID=114 RepID=A0A2Z3GZ49_9BACT|nr:hypothetical protein [Gemmata obscuriglobus]AWM38718.1 hypothetical protein C1280_18130 [Gemmata obscuriglobus]QEG28313.1 hypothetical protein GobsT_30900 [Gemmata obscuriglobus]VTS06163.1 Marine sediment metagenome DNA, contig: S01H1_L02418 OS=marine sediment metagenome GN=S01H1_08263 PE=4 SV=1 [Gemmata obscuriglobus UQM 2246]
MGANAPPNPDDGGNMRRTKISDQKIAAVAALIVQGNFRYVAGKAVGVPPRTFRDWMKRGKEYPDGLYGQFRIAVIAAEAEAERKAVAAVIAAGQDDAKHLEWWLERKFPERWGKFRGELNDLKREIAELKRQIGETQPSETP